MALDRDKLMAIADRCSEAGNRTDQPDTLACLWFDVAEDLRDLAKETI